MSFLRKQIARRDAELGTAYRALGAEKAIEEALAVLRGDSESLGAALMTKLKGFFSRTSAGFEDEDARLFIGEDRVIGLVKGGVRNVLVNGSIELEQAAARDIHREMFDGDGGYGETLFEEAVSFAVLTVLAELQLGERILIEMLSEHQAEVARQLAALEGKVDDLSEFGEWLSLPPPTPPAEADEALYAQRRSVLGRQPSWRRLKLYQVRETLLDEVARQYSAWFDAPVGDSGTLPVFWIKGRSGDGKSVLLLQLAARLLEAHPDTGIFRLKTGERLGSLLEALRNGSGPTLILVDDLHKALAVEDFAEQLDSVLERELANVAVIACGPTPEFDEFRHVCRDQITAESWPIPPTTPSERSELAKWLGVDASAAQANADLLVEFLFELKVGEPIVTFAENFRKRLEARGAFADVQPIVAATALDTSTDARLLPSTDAGDFLRRLGDADQGHFDREAQLPSGRAGVKFSHAQIAARIFVAWWSKPWLGRSIARPLVDAVAPALVAVCRDPLDSMQLTRGLLRRYSALDPSAGVEDPLLAAQLLLDRVASEPAAQAWVLAAMLQSKAAAGLFDGEEWPERAIALASDPSVPGAAQCALATEALLHGAARSRPPDEALQKRVRAVLFDPSNEQYSASALIVLALRHPSEEVSQWPYDWLSVSSSSPGFWRVAQWAGTGRRYKPQIAAVLIARIREDVTQSDVGQLLTILASVLDRLGQEENRAVVGMAMEWLNIPPETPAHVPEVLKTLLSMLEKVAPDQRGPLVEHALEWLGDPLEPPPAAQNVVSALLSLRERLTAPIAQRIVDYAVAWLGKPDRAPFGAQDAISPLISLRGQIKAAADWDIVEYAIAWLGEPAKAPLGTQEVLRTLIQTPAPLEAKHFQNIIDYAIAWIGKPGESPFGSQEVVKPLLGAHERLDSKTQDLVVGCAIAWMGEPDRPPSGIQEVLKVFLSVCPQLAPARLRDVVEYALKWLQLSEEAPAGSQEVLRGLLGVSRRLDHELRGVLAGYATAWLGKADSKRSGAAHVFEMMVTSRVDWGSETHEALREWGVNWLKTHWHGSGAANAAAGLCVYAGSDPEVRELLAAWTADPPSEGSLAYFLGKSHHMGPDLRLRKLAEATLSAVGEPGHRAQIISGMVMTYPDDPPIIDLLTAHLRTRKAPLGPQICGQWFARAPDKAAALLTLLAATQGPTSGQVKFSVGIALAQNQERVLETLPLLPFRSQERIIEMLGRGVTLVEGAPRRLLAKVDRWPPRHSSGLFMALLRSNLPTASLEPPLLDWFRLHERSPRHGYGDVVRVLAHHATRFADLQGRLSNEMRLRVLKERLTSER